MVPSQSIPITELCIPRVRTQRNAWQSIVNFYIYLSADENSLSDDLQFTADKLEAFDGRIHFAWSLTLPQSQSFNF